MASAGHIKRWIVIGGLTSLGFGGLAFCQIIEWLFFENERQMMQHPFWSKAVIGFAVVFLSTLVLVPIQVLVFERRERGRAPLHAIPPQDALGVPFGAFNREARVPNWIRIPVLAVLYILLGIFVLGLLFALFIVVVRNL